MKTHILLLSITILTITVTVKAQTFIKPRNNSRVITTGVPFTLIAADARSASMGDMGVATSADGFSQQWNASKYTFSETKSGIAVSYTPYLSQLVKDIFLGNVTYFNRFDDRSAFGASIRYFSLGDIELVEDEFSESLTERPNELTLDASYALRLSDHYAMSVTMRYLRSDLKITGIDNNPASANTFGVDISGFYQSEENAYSDFNGRWRGGFAIQNLGPKFNYDDGGTENFQPTTLRLGGGFDFIFDEYNTLSLTTEFSKLLVPTPPALGDVFEYEDRNGNGVYDPENGTDATDTDIEGALVENNVIIGGQSQDVNFFKGVFQSFGDAPDGFSEELKEIVWSLGAEYAYQDSFSFRAGYFNESEEKGFRKFIAIGAGFKANVVNIDISYLFSASKVPSPLENTLRFSLTFNIGSGAYSEL